MKLQGQIPECELYNLPMLNRDNDHPYLLDGLQERRPNWGDHRPWESMSALIPTTVSKDSTRSRRKRPILTL